MGDEKVIKIEDFLSEEDKKRYKELSNLSEEDQLMEEMYQDISEEEQTTYYTVQCPKCNVTAVVEYLEEYNKCKNCGYKFNNKEDKMEE